MVASRWAMTSVVRPCISVSERALHQRLAFGVEGRGRLVEKEDRRVLEQRPGDGEALALAAGQRHAALANQRVVALRESGNETVPPPPAERPRQWPRALAFGLP